jgi:hypothetical protein
MIKRALAGVVLLCSIALPAHAGDNSGNNPGPCSATADPRDSHYAQGFELFSGAWKYGIGGQITQGSSAISLDQDQGIKVSGQPLMALRWCTRHPYWWVPDVSAGYEHLGASGSYLAPSNFQFGSIVLIQDQTLVQAGVNINSFDGGLDWRLPDLYHHRLQLAMGVEFKYLAGHYTVVGINSPAVLGLLGLGQIPVIQQQRDSIDKLVPMPLHGRVDFLPWNWLRLYASGGYTTLAGSHLGEWRAAADLQLLAPVSITVGYMEQLYRVKSSPTIIDARLGGPMFGISLHTW